MLSSTIAFRSESSFHAFINSITYYKTYFYNRKKNTSLEYVSLVLFHVFIINGKINLWMVNGITDAKESIWWFSLLIKMYENQTEQKISGGNF